MPARWTKNLSFLPDHLRLIEDQAKLQKISASEVVRYFLDYIIDNVPDIGLAILQKQKKELDANIQALESKRAEEAQVVIFPKDAGPKVKEPSSFSLDTASADVIIDRDETRK